MKGAPKGNEFWKLRNSHGRELKFTVDEMLECITDYLEEISNNLIEIEVATSKGVVKVKKQRPMTVKGLCGWLNIAHVTWLEYKKRKDFTNLITRTEEIIYDQKYTYAAIGEFNANIIARDLGLIDKKDIQQTGQSIVIESSSPKNKQENIEAIKNLKE